MPQNQSLEEVPKKARQEIKKSIPKEKKRKKSLFGHRLDRSPVVHVGAGTGPGLGGRARVLAPTQAQVGTRVDRCTMAQGPSDSFHIFWHNNFWWSEHDEEWSRDFNSIHARI